MNTKRRSLTAAGFVLSASALTLAMVVLPSPSTEAAAPAGAHTFIVPASSGYGVTDCVASGASCGKIVADAWCEAQGFTQSSTFGPADPEATGSIGGPISVTCSQ